MYLLRATDLGGLQSQKTAKSAKERKTRNKRFYRLFFFFLGDLGALGGSKRDFAILLRLTGELQSPKKFKKELATESTEDTENPLFSAL